MGWVASAVVARWQLEWLMYDFKNSVFLIFSIFIESKIFFPGAYFSVGIKNDLAQGGVGLSLVCITDAYNMECQKLPNFLHICLFPF